MQMLSAPMIFWTIRLLNLEVSLKTRMMTQMMRKTKWKGHHNSEKKRTIKQRSWMKKKNTMMRMNRQN